MRPVRPFDRILIFLYALAGTISAIILGSLLTRWTWAEAIFSKLAAMPGSYETALILLAFFFFTGLILIWRGIYNGNKHAVLQEGMLGQVRIALSAIETLAEKVVLEQKGVKEANAVVEEASKGICIRIRTTVTPDVKIPQLSQNLQGLVSDKILEVTGIEVHDIRILVENISAQKMRVE